MLDIHDVTVDLGGERILDGVDLTVSRHEIVAILGPSGSGKSTLLKAIAGLIPLTRGSVSWDGTDLEGIAVHERDFGLMFQGFALFPHLDVGENVRFGLKKGEEARVAEALDMVGLAGFERRSVADLSGGERQRVALARTLAPEPRLVMLDEPMGSLDRSLRERLVVETRHVLIGAEATAIVVTHDREEAVAMADRLALMREGRIIQSGTLDEILASPVDEWATEFLA